MLKKIKDILAALKKQGVEIGEDAVTAVSKQFDDFVLVNADRVIGEGQIVVNEDSHKEKMDDLKKYKNAAKKFEQDYTELKESVDSGDSLNKTLFEKADAEVKRLAPIVETYMKDQRKTWATVAEHIPDNLKSFYTFAEKDKELDDTTILANVKKMNEHTVIGALTIDTKAASTVPRTTKTGEKVIKAGTEDWRDLPPHEKIRRGYADKHPEPQIVNTPTVHPNVAKEGSE